MNLAQRIEKLRKERNEVRWVLPGQSLPFATTRRSTLAIIRRVGQAGTTCWQAISLIAWDRDAVDIMEWFCAKGFGDRRVAELVG